MKKSGPREAWQSRLVPFMVGMVMFSAVFFAAVSFHEFERVHETLVPPKTDLSLIIKSFDDLQPSTFEERLMVAEKKAVLVTTQESTVRRYQQAHAIILSRVWTRFMAFITGTLMALIGSAFVLGKLKEDRSALTGLGGGYSISLATSSPGILLASLGTVLMLASIFSYFQINTTDAQPYSSEGNTLPSDILAGAPNSDILPPAPPSPEPQSK